MDAIAMPQCLSPLFHARSDACASSHEIVMGLLACRVILKVPTANMQPYQTAPLTVALYQPDIPQNTGTILRMCACLGLAAAIIEPAGFLAGDKHFHRAGMDYLAHVEIARYPHWAAFEEWRRANGGRLVLLTTSARVAYTAFSYLPGDILLVGREFGRCGGRSSCRRRCASRHPPEAADAVAERRRRRGNGSGRSRAAARRNLLKASF